MLASKNRRIELAEKISNLLQRTIKSAIKLSRIVQTFKPAHPYKSRSL